MNNAANEDVWQSFHVEDTISAPTGNLLSELGQVEVRVSPQQSARLAGAYFLRAQDKVSYSRFRCRPVAREVGIQQSRPKGHCGIARYGALKASQHGSCL